jgi:hypothetical protein
LGGEKWTSFGVYFVFRCRGLGGISAFGGLDKKFRFQGFKVSRFQGFKVSRFQGFKVSRFQGFEVLACGGDKQVPPFGRNDKIESPL